MLFSAVNAESFDAVLPFTVQDNGLNVSGSFSGNFNLSVSSQNNEPINAAFFILDSENNQVFEQSIENTTSFSQSISLEPGEYALIFNNKKTGFQNPKIYFNLARHGENSGMATTTPNLLSPLNILIILAVLIVLIVFVFGRGKDKKLKAITGKHPTKKGEMK